METPYPFSPGTSPEPTSPVLPPSSPEVSCTTSEEALSPCHGRGESNASNTRSVASNAGSTTLEQSPGATFRGAAPSPHNANCQAFISGEHFTSSDEGQTTSAAEAPAATSRSTPPTSSTTCSDARAATAGLNTFASESTGIESSSVAGPATSTCKRYTSTSEPTGSSSSAGGTGPVGCPELLGSLQQLALRGDDTHLPQYLHQVTRLPSFLLFISFLFYIWTRPIQLRMVCCDRYPFTCLQQLIHTPTFFFFVFSNPPNASLSFKTYSHTCYEITVHHTHRNNQSGNLGPEAREASTFPSTKLDTNTTVAVR